MGDGVAKVRGRLRDGSLLLWVVARVLAGLCVVSTLGYVAAFLWIAVNRASYPFDLEWMEGGLVSHLERLLAGKPLYTAPSVDFVPYIYNPLYYLLAAPIAAVVGVDYLPLRIVSIVATLSCFGLIFGIVWRETRALVPALFAVGAYAGSFELSGAWFDIARVDSTSLAFCLGAWFLARDAGTRTRLVGSAALALAAVATKQSALALVPIWLVAVAGTRGLRACLWLLVPLLPFVLGFLWLERSSDGWYSYFAFKVPTGFPSVPEMYVKFWKVEIFREFPVPLALSVYFLAFASGAWDRTPFRFHAPFVAGMVFMAYLVRLHAGSYANDKMAAHAALAVGAGLGLGALTREDDARRLRGELFGYALGVAQFLVLLYEPKEFLPTPADRSEGQALVAAMKNLPGEVLVTHHSHYPRRAGKPSMAHGMAVFDVVRTANDYKGAKKRLEQSFAKALSSHRFGGVFTDDGLVYSHLVERFYRSAPATFVHDGNALLPRTGVKYRPRHLFVPR